MSIMKYQGHDVDCSRVHDTPWTVILDPKEEDTREVADIFNEEPGAITIINDAGEEVMRMNLASAISLIHSLTDMWMVSYYG